MLSRNLAALSAERSMDWAFRLAKARPLTWCQSWSMALSSGVAVGKNLRSNPSSFANFRLPSAVWGDPCPGISLSAILSNAYGSFSEKPDGFPGSMHPLSGNEFLHFGY